MRYLVLLLLLAACGPTDFTGRFRGKMDAIGSCAGKGSVFIQDAVWVVYHTVDGLGIELVGGVSCATLNATINGNVASITPRSCNSFVASGTTVRESVGSGGEMTLNGDSLKIAFNVTAQLGYADGTYGSCSDSVGGTLTR